MDSMDVGDFLEILNGYVAVRYTNVAFLMVLVYDHILTFEAEVSQIWTLPWRLPKFLFLINRYLIPPMLVFDGLIPSLFLGSHVGYCGHFSWVEDALADVCLDVILPRALPTLSLNCDFLVAISSPSGQHGKPTILSLGTVDVILVLRVLALYGHNKKMERFLIALTLCTFGAWLGLSIPISYKTTSMPGGPIFTGCLFAAPKYFFAAWIPPAFFESVIIVLTLYQVFRYNSMTPTLRVLTRDSIIYFTLVFLILMANLFIAMYGKGFIGALLIVPCSVVACIAASRMTMNVRQFTMTSEPPVYDIELATMSFRAGEEPTVPTTHDPVPGSSTMA